MEIKLRDTYFDFLRGVAILLVIGIHTYSDGWMHINLFFRQFLNCAVPMFLAISGYFVGKKSFCEKGAYFTFLKKQIPRVYIPMLFWSLPWAVFSIRSGDSLLHTLLITITGGMSIYYFIILIMQYYVLTPVIQRVVKTKWGGVICCVITLIGILTFKYFVTIQRMPLSMVESGSPFPVWLIFFALGVAAAQNAIKTTHWSSLLLITLITVFLSFSECLLTYKYFDTWNHGIKPSSHIYSFFIILLIFHHRTKELYERLKGTRLDNIICYVGRVSFFMYLTHMLLLRFIRKLLPSNWIVMWITISIVAVSFAWGVEKVIPTKIRKYIGF